MVPDVLEVVVPSSSSIKESRKITAVEALNLI
jgi:hypothetical protein